MEFKIGRLARELQLLLGDDVTIEDMVVKIENNIDAFEQLFPNHSKTMAQIFELVRGRLLKQAKIVKELRA